MKTENRRRPQRGREAVTERRPESVLGNGKKS